MTDVRGDETTAALVTRLSQQTTELVRAELKLAQLEMTRKAKYAGFGAGALAAAALVAVLGLGALVATAIISLDLALPTWLAGLAVTVGLFVVAGGLALFGRGKVRHAVPPQPERTVANVQQDIETLKESRHRDHA